jgi:hypothetical protein
MNLFWKRKPRPVQPAQAEHVTIQYFDDDRQPASKTVSAARYAELLNLFAALESDESLEFNRYLQVIE